jgi:hypothetical protein
MAKQTQFFNFDQYSLCHKTIIFCYQMKLVPYRVILIVGRSLDMFISKLRKKLESDPNIKIVVIRGKGYKLEISS